MNTTRLLLTLGVFVTLLSAQTRPPVVFVRGYDFNSIAFGACSPSQPSDTFGTLPNEITSQGAQVLWFDHCTEAAGRTVNIETLGQMFGQFLARQQAPQVDIVAHSMGGLIVRAYLAGMQSITPPLVSRTFTPPADPRIRRAVFIATPHFGIEEVSTLIAGVTDAQVLEMRQGSSFLYELARWNQGTDDLRGIDSVAIIGSSGTGAAPLAGNTDGLVSTNSASLLSFGVTPTRTRALPNCHTGVLALFGLCTGSSIATAPETSAAVRSFLAGTDTWQTVGTAFQGTTGGVMISGRDASDRPVAFTRVTYGAPANDLTQGAAVAFKNFVPSGTYTFAAQSATAPVEASVIINPGAYRAALLKPPPVIGAVFPAAGVTDARVVAPGQLISLYGAEFSDTTAQATSLASLPTTLAGATLSTGVTALPLLIVTPAQVNAYIPGTHATGLTNLTLRNAKGQHVTPLLVAPAAFTFFTLNSSGTGAGIAQHGADSSLITEANPARPGEVIVIYGTGLGATRPIAGLDYAINDPVVTASTRLGTIAQTVEVQFAGRTPGFVGLDQLNIRIPLDAPRATPLNLTATSAGRTSNTVTIPIQ